MPEALPVPRAEVNSVNLIRINLLPEVEQITTPPERGVVFMLLFVSLLSLVPIGFRSSQWLDAGALRAATEEARQVAAGAAIRDEASALFLDLARALPADDVWLEVTRQAGADWVVAGRARSARSVDAYVSALEGRPRIGRVELESIAQTPTRRIDFKLRISAMGGGETL